MPKIRVAYLMHGARNVGGGEYALYSLVKNLRRDIFEPIVFYSHENEIVKKLMEDAVHVVQIPLNKKITSVYRDEIQKDPFSLFVYLCYLLSGIFQIIKLLNKYKIDILHPHDNLSKIMGGVAVKLTRKKAVTHCHDLLQNNLIDKLLLFYQLIVMDRIIAVSESVKSVFRFFNKIPGKVCVVHNGIDITNFSSVKNYDLKITLGLSSDATVIGVIAVFDACKGHVYLFHAIKKLVSDGLKDIVCLVIGDGRMGNELRTFVVHERLEPYIRFLGYRTDVSQLLTIVDIVAIPSLQESFGITALEAMAMKVPVIATDVGGLQEIVAEGETGMLVQPANIDALYGALKYLIQHADLRQKMGEAGKKRVENMFSLEKNVRKTEEIYLNVLKID